MKRFISTLAVVLLLPAVSQASEYWAQFALGGGYTCKLMISNQTNRSWSGAFWIRQGDNQPWQGNWFVNGQDFSGYSHVIISLKGNETRVFNFVGDHVTRSGYMEIQGDSTEDLSISYFYEYWSPSGMLLDSIGSPPSSVGDDFLIPIERADDAHRFIDTGIAWCSYWNPPFYISVVLYDHNGREIMRKAVTFTGHKAQFLGQLLDDAPANMIGSLSIQSARYIFVEVLRFVQNKADRSFQYTSTPAIAY